MKPGLLAPLAAVFALSCSSQGGAGTTDGDGSTTALAGLDLAQIDRACERLLSCDLSPRLVTNATRGDCRLALGLLLSAPVANYQRVVSFGMATTITRDLGNAPARMRAAVTCALAANTCAAMAACVGRVPREVMSLSACDDDIATRCGDPFDPANEGYCLREDCSSRGARCVFTSNGPRCELASAPEVAACEGNVLVLPTGRVDCGASARCVTNTRSTSPDDSVTTASCEPTGQVCARGLGGVTTCGGWVPYAPFGTNFPLRVPEVLLTGERPTGGPCAGDASQGATSCVDASTLRVCLGNTERSVTCASRCQPTSRPISPEVTGACR